MSLMKKKLITFTLVAYILTILFFIVLEVIGGRENSATFNMIGISMLIPVIGVFVNEKIIYKDVQTYSYGIQFKLNKWIIFAICFPIIMWVVLLGISICMRQNTLLSQKSLFTNIIIGITIASISGLVEESAWRGYLYQILHKIGTYKTIIIISVIWSLWHVPVTVLYKYPDNLIYGTMLNVFQMFSFSLILTYVRQKSQSIIGPAFMHGLMNTLLLSRGALEEFAYVIIKITLCILVMIILVYIESYIKNRRIIKWKIKENGEV